jgi:hypothetical protein
MYVLQNKNLVAHVKALHSAARPYPCPEPYCDQAFGFKSVLERHMLRCHGCMALLGPPGGRADSVGRVGAPSAVTEAAAAAPALAVASNVESNADEVCDQT